MLAASSHSGGACVCSRRGWKRRSPSVGPGRRTRSKQTGRRLLGRVAERGPSRCLRPTPICGFWRPRHTLSFSGRAVRSSDERRQGTGDRS